ncbi:hypothetical protein C8J56DRAFT_1056870 [Mycena floridula]|nr:hypothetical protein C8J56DRAFT_1056870 [Mycena floridula]
MATLPADVPSSLGWCYTLQYSILTIKHPQHGQIGTLHAIVVHRATISTDFFEVMDEDSQETHDFSIMLFDKHCHVRRHLVEPGARAGIRCWGEEMNSGNVIYLKDMTVNDKFTGQGIGSYMLGKLVTNSDVVEQDDIIYCWPAPTGLGLHLLTPDERKERWNATQDRQINFFRKNHFRRVGRTCIFGFSPEADHPSRSIAVDADVSSLEDEFDSPGGETMAIRHPLHSAISNNKTPAIAEAIQLAYNADPTSIHSIDSIGFTPLGVAALSANIHAVRKLLSWDMTNDLMNAANVEGLTPLEAVQASMRPRRNFVETFRLPWTGYRDGSLEIEYLLKQAMQQSLPMTLEQYQVQRKFGCTCGSCQEGWLSRRMRYRLAGQAAISTDKMTDSSDQFVKGQVHDAEDICMLVNGEYIPPSLYPNFFKTFYLGYTELFGVARDVLCDPAMPRFNKEAMISVLRSSSSIRFSSSIQFFFNKGGRIEYVLDAIMNSVICKFNDGVFEPGSEDWDTFPVCANDEEFMLVRDRLGLSSQEQWGPYHHGDDLDWKELGWDDSDFDSEEEEENDEEDDDDDDDDEEEDDDEDEDEEY